jgi:hypothetical protein
MLSVELEVEFNEPVSPTTRIALLYRSADFPEASSWLEIHLGKK